MPNFAEFGCVRGTGSVEAFFPFHEFFDLVFHDEKVQKSPKWGWAGCGRSEFRTIIIKIAWFQIWNDGVSE